MMGLQAVNTPSAGLQRKRKTFVAREGRRRFFVASGATEELNNMAMQCPIDGTTLVIAERQGVEIDYCPQCRGVWLDRGELDKILERSSRPSPETFGRRDDDRRNFDSGYSQKKKKKGWLDEIFDF